MVRRCIAALVLGCTSLGALAADLKAGEVKAQLCLLCHKPNRFIPLLEQQPAEYLALSLQAYKTGRRTQTSMTINAASLSETDISDLSAYFATKEFPGSAQDLDPTKVSEGRKLVSDLGCSSCHAPDFRGKGATPRLAGQTYRYLAGQIEAFRAGGRAHPAPLSGMKEETDAERAASYLASLR